MLDDVLGFFISKVAEEEDDDRVIDPGEAAAAGIAIAGSKLSRTVVPFLGSMAASKLRPKPHIYAATPWYGIPRLQDSALFDLMNGDHVADESMKQTHKLLNMFDIGLKPKGPLVRTADGLKNIPLVDIDGAVKLDSISKSVDSMVDSYGLREKGLKFDVGGGPVTRLRGPSYSPSTNRISLPWINEDFALHEVGHAAHLRTPAAKAINTARRMIRAGTNIAIPMAYIAGDEIKKMFPGEIDDKIVDFVQENAPSLLAATWAASDVYPEVQATTRAINHVLKTKGAEAAKSTLKALLPDLASRVIPIIPAVVGISLAKKYYFNAKKKEQEKTAGISDTAKGLWGAAREIGSELGGIGSQVSYQAGELVNKPFKEFARSMWDAGVANIKSPEFVQGAVMAGVPTAALAYVYHNTHHGKKYRERSHDIRTRLGMTPKVVSDMERLKESQKNDSATWPAIAGIGAALSGGFLAKMYADLYRVL